MLVGDVKIWRTIESPSDAQGLQNDINQLSNWSQRSPMSFHTDKYVVFRLYAKDSYPQYQRNGERLRCARYDLGVMVDETLKPHHNAQRPQKNSSSIMRQKHALFIDFTPALRHFQILNSHILHGIILHLSEGIKTE